VRAAITARRSLPVVPIGPGLWRRWEKAVRPAVTAMLVVDASMSSQAYLQGLGDILNEVFAQFFDPLSRVGLVAITNGGAELVFPPTRNRRRVFGRVKDLVPGGHSPLAEALSVSRRELLKARKIEGAKNCFVLLVSDCYPEPIPHGTADIYDSEPYRRARLEAGFLGHSRLPVAILDPMNVSSGIVESLPGRRLARFIARATLGVLIPVPSEKIKHKGFSVVQLLGAEQDRNKKLAQQIAGQLEVYRKQQTQPGGPLG
jgi:Mg-chelatase subunit ChlD